MAVMVDTEARLADALRVLLPMAVADCPEWAPDSVLASRNVAYMAAHVALLDYDEARSQDDDEQPAVATAPIEHLLPRLSTDEPLPLAA